MQRKSGILMPIFSMPSEFGIGDFGKNSYNFIDIMAMSKQKVWQVLPLVQTGFGNSPYQSVYSKSFNPYFISPEILVEKGLLKGEELDFTKYNGKYINYGFLYNVRYPLLRKAFSRFNINSEDFKAFIKSKEYLDYALFMALKYYYGQKDFYYWEDKYKFRDKNALNVFAKEQSEELLFWQFIQYEAKSQWLKVKEYANNKGVEIIGDMPLYVAHDSVDVWVSPQLFKLDENLFCTKKAGVPPDYFSADGQLWGNPVYNYDEHKKNNFSWWANRVKDALINYDYLRIDHFRGLDKFYEVDGNAVNAKIGKWVDVPSKELINAIHKKANKNKIIAEDLGIIDDGVRELLKYTNYPGMKILSFAFNGEKLNPYLPQNINENSICYTGSHDNDTLKGLIESFSAWDKKNFVCGVKNSINELNIQGDTDKVDDLIDSVIQLGIASKSKIFIIPLQDVLKKGGDYRVNEPGQLNEQNWSIMFSKSDLDIKNFERLKELTIKYKR